MCFSSLEFGNGTAVGARWPPRHTPYCSYGIRLYPTTQPEALGAAGYDELEKLIVTYGYVTK